ncbi:hypothetical protein [Streptomyces sp. VRA16 Mangrove soil]|uniref:hypothetical protein n=1 Tax=Streptomyces sp. VRA16 Mangrove soil TaxID=2817434 RepID=UPI001A9D6A3C|nr:hypothetical protein [Streptomyces sp. VRA16 Mangrove soil]MBO1331373.1 hypothetical protein [Streptomyces sp. VRA16 Mangrove soil]
MSRYRRPALSRITVLAAVVAALVATGCSPDRDRTSPALPHDAPDTSRWTLPLTAYQPTEEERQILLRAEHRLVRACMRRFAIDWRPPADLPVVGPRNSMDWRYGIHDARLAATRGFQPDAAQQRRHDRAMRAEAKAPALSPDQEVVLGGTDLPPEARDAAGKEVRDGTYRGRKVPHGGCFTEARDRLRTTTYGVSPLAADLYSRSFPAATRDPAVRAVFRRWSACMKDKGFTYKTPVQLFDDPRFGRQPHKVTGTETAVALADIGCRARLPVAETWHAAETRLQRRYVREHADRLNTARRALDRSLTEARKVLS